MVGGANRRRRRFQKGYRYILYIRVSVWGDDALRSDMPNVKLEMHVTTRASRSDTHDR
jgi:hypothetical protein